MGVPQLESCCCGCTLKTGTKIIGWLSLVGGIIMTAMMGMTLGSIYYIEDHPNIDSKEAQIIREHLPAMKALTMFMIVVYLATCALSFMLLLGAYQNKARLVYFWVVIYLTITILGQLLTITQLITVFNIATFIGNLIGLLLELYCILVVYSFYREIQNVSGYP